MRPKKWHPANDWVLDHPGVTCLAGYVGVLAFEWALFRITRLPYKGDPIVSVMTPGFTMLTMYVVLKVKKYYR
jgi:hypothetical protein